VPATIIPRLTLVGAGPGHPDLLKHAPPKAQLIFVGKRAGNHSLIQDEINKLIIEHALQSGHVVRLKGGDPFVFGRGLEEMDYAAAYGIPTAVVPGISSSIAVPELHGISLTKRGVADSFWVVTGTTAAGQTSSDLHIAATSSATVVILMGINKLPEIVEIFKATGKANTAVAIIQNGSLENERKIVGTISSIAALARSEGISAPAIIVVGDVVC
jgi:uroporphyrin-III C-methyltransferase